jgi:S-adenosylmethionine synthetase
MEDKMYKYNNEKWFFSSESVTEGHPDKICDQISDSVLDAILSLDKSARVACETAVANGMILVIGEITTDCYVDIPFIARNTVSDIGYNRAKFGFDAETCAVLTSINEQSKDISMGVDTGGAGDQGMMFGYACRDTQEEMPLPISLAHALCQRLAEIRKTNVVDYLRPDGKSQVTIEYSGTKPIRVDTIVLSAQHSPDIEISELKKDIMNYVISPVIPTQMIDENTRILINPTGRFVEGGPKADSGLTGRKIIVDTYGGFARHGGGAFSGKDPTKVDRSGAYAARYIAKNIVRTGIVSECEVQLAYAIGVDYPVSLMVDTFGTGSVQDGKLAEIISRIFDLRPKAIIERFQLQNPIYRQTATYGHFGRKDLDLPWEKDDLSSEITKLL